MADEEGRKQCKHNLCECAAEEGSDYCSKFCEDAQKAKVTAIRCDCQHAPCS
jgi:hypothetical protein